MTTTDKRAKIFRWRSELQRSDVPFDVRSTLWMLAQYADNNTLVCWPGQKTLMEDNKLSKSSLNRKLDKALLSGWLMREERGGKIKGKNTEYRLVIGPAKNWVPEVGHEETADESWVPDMENWVPDMGDLGPENGTPTTHELLVNNYSSIDIRSTDVDRDIQTEIQNQTQAQEEETLTSSVDDGFQETRESSSLRRGPLPADWHPNGAHVAAAKRRGLKATALADVFKEWATREGVVSSDWDAKFGYLIAACGENDTRSPEDHGMDAIGSYSDHPDDPEWFLRDVYRWTPPVTAPAVESVALSPEWVPNEESRTRAENLGHDADVVLQRLRDECLGNPAVTSPDWDDAYRKLALRIHSTETSKTLWVAARESEWASLATASA